MCSGFGLSRLEVCEHLGRVASHLGDLVSTMDPTVWIDEIAVAHRILGILLIRGANDFVLRPDRAIHVAQQSEREVLGLGERQVLGWCVERCAENDGIELFESVGTVTQALTLGRSTGCCRFRIPPQQHPVTTKILEANDPAVLVRQFEIRRNRMRRRHRQSLA